MPGPPRVRAVHPYTAKSEHELSFNAGDILTILNIRDENWLEGELNGIQGFVPAQYVDQDPLDDSDNDNDDSSSDDDDDADDNEDSHPNRLREEEEPVLIQPKKVMPNRGGLPDLAKAIKMHHVMAKHEHRKSGGAINEFQRQFTQIKKKAANNTKADESELSAALLRRKESTQRSIDSEQRMQEMPELHRRFMQK